MLPVQIAVSTKVLLFTIELSNPGITETVRRTRGRFALQGVGEDKRLGALGFVIVNDLAAAAGVASMPGPVTDASDEGWFVWEPFVSSKSSAAALESVNYEFDSKGMRKLEQGFQIAVIVENASAEDQFFFEIGFSLLASRT